MKQPRIGCKSKYFLYKIELLYSCNFLSVVQRDIELKYNDLGYHCKCNSVKKEIWCMWSYEVLTIKRFGDRILLMVNFFIF
jgi:hypothetical protein